MIPKEGRIGFRLAMTTQRERQGQCSVSYTYVCRINALMSFRGKLADDIQYPDTTSSAGGYDAGVDIRAGAHSDYGASRVLVIIIIIITILSNPLHKRCTKTIQGSLTLLFQRENQSGLEILSPHGWSPVPVYPSGTSNDQYPPILVNVGDLLSFWTNGYLKSTVHRVVSPKEGAGDRYSIAYFCHPLHDTRLVQIPSNVVRRRDHGGKGEAGVKETITAKEHLSSRLAATYGFGIQDDPEKD